MLIWVRPFFNGLDPTHVLIRYVHERCIFAAKLHISPALHVRQLDESASFKKWLIFVSDSSENIPQSLFLMPAPRVLALCRQQHIKAANFHFFFLLFGVAFRLSQVFKFSMSVAFFSGSKIIFLISFLSITLLHVIFFRHLASRLASLFSVNLQISFSA